MATAAFATAACVSQASARTVETDKARVNVERIAGVEHPWGIALIPDGRFLVTERNSGRLQLGSRDGRLMQVEGVPKVFHYKGPTGRSQAGLFHVAPHPDFADNRLIYFSFAQPSEEGAGTAIARGRLVEEGDKARLDNVEVIYTPKAHDSSGLHFGGRFAFHPKDKSIVMSIGERRNMSRAQKRDDEAGSFIRVMDDGSVPKDNPFVGQNDAAPAIYALGNRNSQGLAFHPQTGALWANDHGPRAGDEINKIEGGKNYGWPMQAAGVDYSGAPIGKGARGVDGMTDPAHVFERTVGPSGLAFYTGEMFPEWRGHMLHGGLAARALVRTSLDGDKVTGEEWMLRDLDRRIRDVQVASDGAIWLVTEHPDGEVLRLSRADAATVGSGKADRGKDKAR
ncbi:PQQ-dependent sugar dehydrogenase [Rhodopseudomonas palustris]|uniref:PQQ-dependent sugar dehydrogenase n=1 Tax=Rhodopseudomonas palustris TaxID=1076 RepID=UPI002ACDA55E|nr:PQQ-dependent sugar dehydrogenase [Rhodopseudomonas palustris]WQH01541.1 PQQ-dependent sugar dehydrogenase [Rhodopseudomonas palustris]